MKRIVLLAFLFALPAFGQLNSNTLTIRFAGAPTGPCSPFMYAVNNANGDFYDCKASVWFKVSGSGGSGTVTSVATTSPITGGTITGTGTIACATCTTSTSPGAGVAHFAGSTQDMTSSAIVAADITSGTITGTQLSSSLALPNGNTATTQSASDNSTKLATTAYVDRVAPQVKTISGSNQAITNTSGAPGNIFAFTIPSLAGAQRYAIHCSILYSQTTAGAGDGFAFGVATNSPTRVALQQVVWTAATGTNSTGIQSSTSTGYVNLATFTPAVNSINYFATLDGALDEPASTANTLNIGAFTGNGSNAINIIQGTWCSVTPGS